MQAAQSEPKTTTTNCVNIVSIAVHQPSSHLFLSFLLDGIIWNIRLRLLDTLPAHITLGSRTRSYLASPPVTLSSNTLPHPSLASNHRTSRSQRATFSCPSCLRGISPNLIFMGYFSLQCSCFCFVVESNLFHRIVDSGCFQSVSHLSLVSHQCTLFLLSCVPLPLPYHTLPTHDEGLVGFTVSPFLCLLHASLRYSALL